MSRTSHGGNSEALLQKYADNVRGALQHLTYSYTKVGKLGLLNKPIWCEEDLEVLESFASRFSRAADIIVSRYLRSLALQDDPAYQGSLIDLLNVSEKTGRIDSAATWYRIRELRNIAAHDDTTDDLRALYHEFMSLAPSVLAVRVSTAP